MAINTFPATSADKTRRVITLTSGTSWTVPAGVTFVNATLIGGGGGGGGSSLSNSVAGAAVNGLGGAIVESTVVTTPGTNISYSIGAGGTGGSPSYPWTGGFGGSTTFTGATTAAGGGYGMNFGVGIDGAVGTSYLANNNGGGAAGGNSRTGGTGGSGCIILEYWA